MNINWAQRAPEVNELYSAGLHQGVSGIEEGNEQLNSERSLKVVWTNFLNINDKLYVELTSYYQWINDYIFLQPLLEPRLTIRGAFPVYQYQQTNATITGLDALIKSEITNQLSSTLKYSIVRGRDQTQKTPLVLMPADQISSQWNYSLHNMKYLKNSTFSIEGLYQWRQSRLESFQDFLAPPDGYFLMNTSFSTDISIRKKSIYISLQVDNLFDLSYRDYLNRLRYYADETGRSLRLIVKYKF
jgi:iron complex outermembrane recepter protein